MARSAAVTRWLAAGLLFLAWHFATTFFVPATGHQGRGTIVWPFGQSSRPALDSIRALAPGVPPGSWPMTVALVLAGSASLAFLAALASLFGVILPSATWAPAVVLGASASGALFLLYLSRWALVPLVVDAVLLWGIVAAGWETPTLSAP
jgi:hypothetical protein